MMNRLTGKGMGRLHRAVLLAMVAVSLGAVCVGTAVSAHAADTPHADKTVHAVRDKTKTGGEGEAGDAGADSTAEIGVVPPVGPYYKGSELASHIRILTDGGTDAHAQDAGFSGDWRVPEDKPGHLHIWQGLNSLHRGLKVCVVAADAAGASEDSENTDSGNASCLQSDEGSDGYEVSAHKPGNDGEWADDSDSSRLSAQIRPIASGSDAPTYIYIKIGKEITVPAKVGSTDQPAVFAAGTIVRLPVSRDDQAPHEPKFTVLTHAAGKALASGDSVDFADDGQVSLDRGGHVLRTDGNGIVVAVSVKDQGGLRGDDNPEPSAEELDNSVSGYSMTTIAYQGRPVDPASVQCRASGNGLEDEHACYFAIDSSFVSGGDNAQIGRIGGINLSDFTVDAYDVAGNTSSPNPVRLNTAEPFKPAAGADGNPVEANRVSKVDFYTFPRAGDASGEDLKLAVDTVGASDKALCGTDDAQACEDGMFAPAKKASVEPVVSQRMARWYRDLAAFGPKLTYSWKSQSGTRGSSECTGANACAIVGGDASGGERIMLGEGRYDVIFTITYASHPSMLNAAIDAASGNGDDTDGRDGAIKASLSGLTVDGTVPSLAVQTDIFDNSDEWFRDNHFVDSGSSKDGNVRVLAAVPAEQGARNKELKYRICAADKLGTLANSAGLASCPTDDDSGTSGVGSLEFSYMRYPNYKSAIAAARGESSQPAGQREIRKLTSADGATDFSISNIFDQDGAYPLSDMSVKACDEAGNCTASLSLSKSGGKSVIQIGDAHGKSEPLDLGYDMLIIDTDAQKSANIDLSNAAGVPASADPYYHRGSVNARLSITDKWFDVVRRLRGQGGNPLKYSLCQTQEPGYGDLCQSGESNNDFKNAFPHLELDDFHPEADGSGTWVVTVGMPKSMSDASHRSVEGRYGLRLDYTPIGHTVASVHSPVQRFCVDYTAPTVEKKVHYSATGQAYWGWIFARGDERIDIRSHDALSGVNDAGTSFDGRWQGAPEQPQSVTSTDGRIEVTFGTDSQRLTIAGSTAHVVDRAGNESSFDLGDAQSNLPRKTVGIVIDTMAPGIVVTYDNDDVRNGKYYKAHRHATVTVTESNFDFIVANDPWRAIATGAVDGSKSGIAAKEFKNEGGDGRTWTAVLPCERDGDWSVDADLTDLAEHHSNHYHSEFTVDTQKPVLNIRFDNNHAESGHYYKAARRATLTQTERNFSGADTVIVVSAKNAEGAPAAPPAPHAWSGADKDYKRTTDVDFTQELHYALKVEATDLAGNTADAVEEPEFVIDMTKPKLVISNVNDKTAYPGDVTPYIDYSDTNFDPAFTNFTLTRTHKPGRSSGENAESSKSKVNSVFVKYLEQKNDTSKTVSLDDIDHVVDNDDVYTLTARMKDKAGNEAEQKMVYSLNRFGSNYIVDGATQNMLGRYVKEPHDVRVTEINVSGIDVAKSHVELVRNHTVNTISAGNDYRLTRDNSSGWQENIYDFPSRLFDSDGYYRLHMTSVDEAGNLSQNTMNGKNEARDADAPVNFAVDGQAPDSRIGQLRGRPVFYTPSRRLVVNAKDDVALKSVALSVDGRNVNQWSGESVLAPMTYDLAADQKPHDIELVSTDMAGNTTVHDYDNVVVASSWWSYAMARGFLLPLIAVAIITLTLAVVAVVLMVGQRRRTAYRSNVFRR